jgi:hypothetical protein
MPFATKIAIVSNDSDSLNALANQLTPYHHEGCEIAPHVQVIDIMQNFSLDEQTDGIILWLNLNKTDIAQYLDNFLFEINHHLNESAQPKIFVLAFTKGQDLSMEIAALQCMIEEKLGLDSPSRVSKLSWKFHEAILSIHDPDEIRRIAAIILQYCLELTSPQARPQIHIPSSGNSAGSTSWLSSLRSHRSASEAHQADKAPTT